MKIYKIISVVVVVLLVSAFSVNKEISNEKGYDIEDVATDFKLMNIDGKKVSMSDFKKAKGFIITFTCNTCPYAILYKDATLVNTKYAENAIDALLKGKEVPETKTRAIGCTIKV